MEFKIVKQIGKIWKNSKKTVVKHAPQIMAVAGAGCFIMATYCAIKETPEAMEKLDEKKELDPDMSMLQKAAVVAPAYKRTACLTVAGVAFTAGAWKIETDRFAEMAGIAATALSRTRDLEDAAKEIVGEEKAKEIRDKAIEKDDECPFEDGRVADIPDDYRIVHCRESVLGLEFWATRKQIEERMNECVNEMKDKGYLHVEEYAGLLAGKQCNVDVLWAVTRTDGIGYDEVSCREELDYSIESWQDEYHRLGWEVIVRNDPCKID